MRAGASRAIDLVVLGAELAHRGHSVLLVTPLQLSGRIDDVLRNTTGDFDASPRISLLLDIRVLEQQAGHVLLLAS